MAVQRFNLNGQLVIDTADGKFSVSVRELVNSYSGINEILFTNGRVLLPSGSILIIPCGPPYFTPEVNQETIAVELSQMRVARSRLVGPITPKVAREFGYALGSAV